MVWKIWYFWTGLDFKRISFDTHFYFKGNAEKDSNYLFLYIDDMISVSHDIKEIELIKKNLKSEFEIKNLDPIRKLWVLKLRDIEWKAY